MPQKTWVVGEEVLAPDFNTFVQQQIVARFATVAARDTSWPAATAGPGAMCITYDTATVWVVNSAVAWVMLTAPPTPWTAPALQNGWVNFGAAQPAQYRKVGDVVSMRGGVKSGTSGTVVCTLPVGFRPPQVLYFTILVGGAVAGGYAIINTDGTVVANTPNTGQVDLGTIIFSTVA